MFCDEWVGEEKVGVIGLGGGWCSSYIRDGGSWDWVCGFREWSKWIDFKINKN